MRKFALVPVVEPVKEAAAKPDPAIAEMARAIANGAKTADDMRAAVNAFMQAQKHRTIHVKVIRNAANEMTDFIITKGE